jgi:hypothetical protein
MNGTVLMARGRELIEIPTQRWQQHLTQVPEHSLHRLDFMSADHHRIRYFVVRELPAYGRPMEPETIARSLQMPLAQVRQILEELEHNLFFLVRDESGNVVWAYPVTLAQTPHHLTFGSGETLYAA